MVPTLHIYLLGDFRLISDDTPVASIDVPRLQFLLAYLTLHHKELYFINAENPDVLAIDREMFKLLESEPEWHDGEVVYMLTEGIDILCC